MLTKFKQTIDKGVAAVSVKSNEFIEITKLRTKNITLGKEIQLSKEQIGSVYCSQWKQEKKECADIE